MLELQSKLHPLNQVMKLWRLLADYLQLTLPPIILNAGVPRTNVSLANSRSQLGQIQGLTVKSSTIRSLKHLTKAHFPPFLYLNSRNLQFVQKTSTVLLGSFLFGFAIAIAQSYPLLQSFRFNPYLAKVKPTKRVAFSIL